MNARSFLVVGLFFALPALAGGTLPNPVLFVSQYPVPDDFATIAATFAHHRADPAQAGRGGDLWIRYPDGSLRRLTREAGFGVDGFQGAESIAVRDPSMHWDGQKAVFSMVVGAPAAQFEQGQWFWQLYEVTGLGQGETVVITKVPNQPLQANNIAAVYAPDDSLIFVSDRPRDGRAHLYPQHDEYESTDTPSGLWRLEPEAGRLTLLDHSPSGAFDPMIDSAGRIVYTRWDHLQRDQQADIAGNPFGTFDWASEAADAPRTLATVEIFPEPRFGPPGSNLNDHRFNHFFPWQIHLDGSGHETLNHLGRHELHEYFAQSFTDNPSMVEFIASISGRLNPNSVENAFYLSEDPSTPFRYIAVDAPEFDTHGAGRIFALHAPPQLDAAAITVDYLTHPSSGVANPNPPPEHSGQYRDPIALSDGRVLAVHAPQTGSAGNDGTRPFPQPRYQFRIQRLATNMQGYLEPVEALTAPDGIVQSVSFYDPDVLVSYNGPFWEFDPVEVRSRVRPAVTLEPALPAPEAQIFAEEGVDPLRLARFLRARGLALISVRNNTTRDHLDRQQPFNLRVPGGVMTTASNSPTPISDIAWFEIFQADQVRGIGGLDNPQAGRRPLARQLHQPSAVSLNLPAPDGPQGTTPVFTDGSSAAFVPAQRAVSWQLLAPEGDAVVRERYWITLKPGELRSCDGCHGATPTNQAGQAAATNAPEALRALIARWRDDVIYFDGFVGSE